MKTYSFDLKAYSCLFIIYLVWGTTIGAMRIGVESIPPMLLVCLRFLFSGFILVGYCLLRRELLPDQEALKRQFLIGFLLFFTGNSIVSWAIQHIPTGLAGTLVATNTFWMVGLAALIPPKEKIPPSALMGILLGFLGIVILLLPELMQPFTVSFNFWLGLIATLCMVFCWSAGSIYARKRPTGASLLMDVGIQNLFAGLLLIPIVLLTIPNHFPPPTQSSILALVYLIIFGTIIATPCYFYVLKKLPVAISSTFAYVTPVVTIFFGWLLFGESITNTTIIGTGIILGSVLLVQWVSEHNESSSNESNALD